MSLSGDFGVRPPGRDPHRELGDGSAYSHSATPVTALGITSPISVAPGAYHTCALRTDPTVVCWADNCRGQLGNGTTTNSLTPVQVTLP